jgi:D-lactate dehydrogenase (cytochrome)
MLIKKDRDFLQSYLEDSSNLKGGYAEEVALPESIEELSLLLREANSKRTPVTISGGGTGTTGSRIPFGGMAISVEKLNRILDISEEPMYASLQAGVLVDDLKKACDSKGLFYTSHPTEGTASVGGTIATNASGARSFKYGPTRDYVRRLKMVLPSGDVLDIRRGEERLFRGDSRIRLAGGREIVIPLPSYRMPNVKSSAGYFAKDGMDLIDLFIGQEGTLSVIAEMEIGLVAKPAKIFSSFVFFITEEDAWSFAVEARDASKRSRALGRTAPAIDALSIEYFDSNALGLLRAKNPNVPESAKSAIFFEQEASGKDEEALAETWLELIARHKIGRAHV